MKPTLKASRFLETLRIPEGPNAGKPVKLAPFQEQFVRGAVADGVNLAILSAARGNAKTAPTAGIALGAVKGVSHARPDRHTGIEALGRHAAGCDIRHHIGCPEC